MPLYDAQEPYKRSHVPIISGTLFRMQGGMRYVTSKEDLRSGSGRAQAESRHEQLDHAAGIVARVVIGTNAEVANAIHQF